MARRPDSDNPFNLLALITLVAIAAVLCSASPALAELTAKDITALREQGRQEGWTFTVGENSATMYTLEELCGLRMPENWPADAPFDLIVPSADLPDRYDWRDFDGCPIVKNQGGCGSCWAFATVGALECAIKIKDDLTVDLSEEWLVRCNTHGWGCGGGFFAHDYHEWRTDPCGDYGAVLESELPYTASDGSCGCPYDHVFFINSWAYIGNPWDVPSVDAIKQAIVDYGPVSVGVTANSAMQAYNGGIFNGCGTGSTNHAVVLVGWDDNQGASGVWFMRNSWGTGWGEDGGYMRIPYNCALIGEAACYIDYSGPMGPILLQDDIALDDSQGNSNNRPDPGETGIELIVTVTNVGADALGMTLNVSASHPEIVFADDESSYGDVPRWAQADNTADPIIFGVDPEFPPTIVDFILTFTANGGDFSRTDTIRVDVGQPQFILIDDDHDSQAEYEDYFSFILDSLRTPHVIWDKDLLATPPADTLAEYPYTIWFTGDARSDVLSAGDVAHLRDFLDGGGRLLLTGQDIAEDLANDADSTFLLDYLHVRFKLGMPMILAQGTAGDPISDGHSLPLGGPGGAANQNSPDFLIPTDSHAKVCYTYYGSTDAAGIRLATDDYRVVFLGFGAEAIANDLPGYTKREEVLAGIFDWLGSDEPDYIPGDLDGNEAVDPLDVTYAVNYVYLATDPPPNGLNSADVNGDCTVDPLDVTYLVNFVYLSRGTLIPGCVE